MFLHGICVIIYLMNFYVAEVFSGRILMILASAACFPGCIQRTFVICEDGSNKYHIFQ